MHTDWDAQRERLSAYLDGALSADERAELAAHLPGCAECQRELAALRQTKALLGALPVPTLPRSFTLPETLRPLPARRPSPPLWAGPLQTLGAIAAVVGLAFLVWPALPHPFTQSAGSASYAPVITNGGADSSGHVAMSPSATSSPHEGVASAGSGSPTAAPTATVASTPTHEPPTGTTFAREAQPFPTLPVTGGVLLVGGAAALAIGGLARRRDDGPSASDIAD